jgi:hypothetical protein
MQLMLWTDPGLTRYEDRTPADDNQKVLPSDLCKANRCCLKQDDGASELAKQGESHANGADFGREDLADPKVHGGILACAVISA